MLVAARRVSHAREAFVPTGIRHLQDACYELDNIANNFCLLTTPEANDIKKSVFYRDGAWEPLRQ